MSWRLVILTRRLRYHNDDTVIAVKLQNDVSGPITNFDASFQLTSKRTGEVFKQEFIFQLFDPPIALVRLVCIILSHLLTETCGGLCSFINLSNIHLLRLAFSMQIAGGAYFLWWLWRFKISSSWSPSEPRLLPYWVPCMLRTPEIEPEMFANPVGSPW